MNLKQLPILAVGGLLFSLMSTSAHAEALALSNLQAYSGVNPIQTSCSTCHSTIPSLNAFGSAFLGLGGSKSAYALSLTAQNTLLTADTDGDGSSNLAELQAGTNPAGASTATTAGEASVTGCTTSNLQLPIILSLALLGLGLLVRRKAV